MTQGIFTKESGVVTRNRELGWCFGQTSVKSISGNGLRICPMDKGSRFGSTHRVSLSIAKSVISTVESGRMGCVMGMAVSFMLMALNMRENGSTIWNTGSVIPSHFSFANASQALLFIQMEELFSESSRVTDLLVRLSTFPLPHPLSTRHSHPPSVVAPEMMIRITVSSLHHTRAPLILLWRQKNNLTLLCERLSL